MTITTTKLTVYIIEAKNLPANDLNGLSDPFVVIPDNQPGILNLPKKGFKTHKIKKTLNPIWKEKFTLDCNLERYSDIKFEVYDDNLLSKKVLLGECIINLEFLCGRDTGLHEEWLDLYVSKKNKKTKQMEKVMQGQLHILIQLKCNDFVPGCWIPIFEDKVNVGLGWDFTRHDVFDLDASVTAFDGNINKIESIYYRNLSGLGGSVKHHGDNLTGIGRGDDEVITIALNKVPKYVKFLAVTVNSFRGNNLIKAKSGFIRLYTNTTKLGKYILSKSKDCVGLLLGLFVRDESTNKWFFQVMLDPIEGTVVINSYNSMKILLKSYNQNFNKEVTYIYKPIHPVPNEIVFQTNSWIPITSQMTYVGLGWDIERGMVYDLDSSIIVFDDKNHIVDTIYHKNLKSKDGMINHQGDNKNGHGDGDDEVISINFPGLDKNISSMAVVLNSFKGNPLSGIRGGFIRLFNNKEPIGCHLLNEGRQCTGLLLGIFKKDINTGNWFFQVMIDNIDGTDAVKSTPAVLNLLNHYRLKY